MMKWIKKSLFAKLLIGVLLTIILPFALSNFISYRSNYDSVKNQIISLNNGAMHMGMKEIKDCIDEWQQTALSLYSNDDAMYMLASKQSFTAAERYYIYKGLETVGVSNTEAMAVMYDSLLNGESLNYTKSPFSIPKADFSTEQAMNGGSYILSSYAPTEGSSNKPSLAVYSQNIINLPGYNIMGKITILFRLNKLQKISDSLTDRSPESAVFIYAYDSHIPLFASCPLPQDMPDFADIRDNGNVSGRLNGNKGIFILYEEMQKGIPVSLVKFIPDSIINASATSTLRNALIVQLITIPFVPIFVLMLTLMIIRPIKRLLRNIEKLETGEYDFEVPDGQVDELRGLENRFQIMARRIDTLINKEYRSVLEVSKARLKMLQAQINPHFLYNMLQYISTIALKQGAADVSEKISELGSIFRYNMETEKEIVPLRDEIQHINDYMSLQMGRFSNRLNFSISCPDEALDIYIPKMILQPLLENSIKHGIEKGDGYGNILVSITLGDKLRIRIMDNGIGMEAQVIEHIRQRYENYMFSSESGRGIGVVNVLQRLKIYAGEDFDWSISSNPHVATDIILNIPLKQKEGNDNEGFNSRR